MRSTSSFWSLLLAAALVGAGPRGPIRLVTTVPADVVAGAEPLANWILFSYENEGTFVWPANQWLTLTLRDGSKTQARQMLAVKPFEQAAFAAVTGQSPYYPLGHFGVNMDGERVARKRFKSGSVGSLILAEFRSVPLDSVVSIGVESP